MALSAIPLRPNQPRRRGLSSLTHPTQSNNWISPSGVLNSLGDRVCREPGGTVHGEPGTLLDAFGVGALPSKSHFQGHRHVPHNRILSWSLFSCSLLAAVAGCQRKTPEVAPAEPPVFPVSLPVQRVVTDYVDFTGRTDPSTRWTFAPGSAATWSRCRFKEGEEVKAGDTLFVIDPRPYKAQLDQAKGKSTSTRPSSCLPRRIYARDMDVAKTPGRREPPATRPGQGGGGPRPTPAVKAVRGEPGSLQAQPRFHQGHLADRRPGEPLLSDARATSSSRTRRC